MTEKDLEKYRKLQLFQYQLGKKEEPLKYNGQIRKVVYLTFDDGPGPETDQVLDILKLNNIHATFLLWDHMPNNIRSFFTT
ncbi:hypothetical protein GCM10020331_092580 [Ectobacillus funiculus]